MKALTVSALVCAMMVLTRAAPPPEETPQSGQKERRLVKRWTGGILGWYSFNGRCYRYVPTRMTWAEAEKNCKAVGGNLASAHNIQEYQAIQDVIRGATNSYRQAWIGGSDAEENGQWFWSDGTSFNYQYWCPGEPNNGGGEGQNCMQMNYSDGRCWDDFQCSNKLPSVCVRERC